MRWLGLSLLTLCTVMVGCEQPRESMETIPPVPSSTSGTTDDATDTLTPAEPVAPPTPAATTDAPAVEAPAVETPATEAPATEAPVTEDANPDSAANANADKVRFVADTRLKVPTMMCPFSCWPKVQETLVAHPGVEAVQLAQQAKDGEIDNPVVELKVKPGFDVDSAIAALKKVSFENAAVVN
jgi:periplasmic mercuric ion binding protein